MENKLINHEQVVKHDAEEQIPDSKVTTPFNLNHILRPVNTDRPDTRIKPQMVMQLQRTIGNQRTQQVLQRKKKQRRNQMGTPAEMVREILMTKAEWQKKTASTFNKRGGNSPEILTIDGILEAIDDEFAKKKPDAATVQQAVKKIDQELKSWQNSFSGGVEEARQSVRASAFRELSNQMKVIAPIIDNWTHSIANSPEKREEYLENDEARQNLVAKIAKEELPEG